MGARNYFVGVDLHRNQFTYCVRYSKGEEKVGKEPIENLERFACRLGKYATAVEAIGNPWSVRF